VASTHEQLAAPDERSLGLIEDATAQTANATSSVMPKRVFMFWDQGWGAPDEMRDLAVASWRRRNPSWEIVLLDGDEQTLRPYVTAQQLQAIMHQKLVQHKSDLVRTFVLARNGGVYADADVFCGVPLDSWLHGFLRSAGFFVFQLRNTELPRHARPGAQPPPRRPAANWFLASVPEGAVFTRLSEVLLPRALSNTRKEYYEWHYRFRDLVESDAQVKELWQRLQPSVYASHEEKQPDKDECEMRLRHLHIPPPSGARSWLDAPDCVRVYSRPNCSTVRALVDDWCGKVYKLSRFRGHNHSRDAAVWRAAMLPLCRYIAYDEHQGSPVANGSVMQT